MPTYTKRWRKYARKRGAILAVVDSSVLISALLNRRGHDARILRHLGRCRFWLVEGVDMRCTIQGCPGEYEDRSIVHVVRQRGEVIVIDHVLAEICSVCGDVLLRPDSVRGIEATLRKSTADRHGVGRVASALSYVSTLL